MRWPYTILAYLFAALALAGVVIPGLPTTPFVLLAAWAAARGSQRLDTWLKSHPRLGPPLADWREQHAVAPRAKVIAVAFLIASWCILAWRGTNVYVLVSLAVLFVAVGTFVVTRPAPRR